MRVVLALFLAVTTCVCPLAGQDYWFKTFPKGTFINIFPDSGGGSFLVYQMNNVGWAMHELDAAGNLVAENPLRDSSRLDDEFYSQFITRLADGNFLITGVSIDPSNKVYDYLRKCDAKGHIFWSQFYPYQTIGLAYAPHLIELPDRRLLIVLRKTDTSPTTLTWLDSLGTIQRQSVFPDTALKGLRAISKTSDGTWYALYTVDSAFVPNTLTCLDTAGNILWKQGLAVGEQMFATADGGSIVAERDTVYGFNLLLTARDSLGNQRWRTLVPPLVDYYYQIRPAVGGGAYIQSTQKLNPAAGLSMLTQLLRIDEQGTVVWDRQFPYPEKIVLDEQRLIQQPFGDLILAGTRETFGLSNYFAYYPFVMKMDSLGFRLPNRVAGRVCADDNFSCTADTTDRPLPHWVVRLDQAGATPQYAVTDSLGHYEFETDTGAFSVHLAGAASNWQACTPVQPTVFASRHDTARVDFAVQPLADCPQPRVRIGARRLDRCKNNVYTVRYDNPNPAPTDSLLIRIVPDPFFQFVSAEIPPARIEGDTLWFAVGGLATGQSGQFDLTLKLSCASTPGQVHCVQAHIAPDVYCAPWPGADVRVAAECPGDTLVRLRLHNSGGAGTGTPITWTIIQDSTAVLAGSTLLAAGETLEKAFPATGSFWRIEAAQAPGHPWPRPQRAFVEGCGGYARLGYPAQYGMADPTPFDAGSCLVSNGAPAGLQTKQAFPLGYGPDHFILPGEPIEYTIQFANPIYDDLPWLFVYDTLSPDLDPGTIEPGASSHPYSWELIGPGILKFTVLNTHLQPEYLYPDSAYGFVQFRIRPKAGTPDGTVITNCAEMSLGGHAPYQSNCTTHTVQTDFIPLTVAQRPEPVEQGRLVISPNPARASLELRWAATGTAGPFTVVLQDMTSVRQRQFQTVEPHLSVGRDGWPAGIYLAEIWQGRQLLHRGQLVFTD